MVALMGPSGSGKTTLLNTLAQRQTATVQGQMNINGVEQPLSVHRDISAFVEQEDTLIGSLTVHETLEFSAKLALPRTVTSLDVQARIQQLTRSFGLHNQSQTLIGTPLQKGLSGGQKRRVSVATQLITSPKILYLDEPTSGLDSTASYEVISFLREFARHNKVLMIASIHQPSTKTFELFDQVYVLSQGKTCYYGSTTELPPFFASLGLPVPPMTNPAEHILDITNVDFLTESGDGQSRLDRITISWKLSAQAARLEAAIKEEPGVLGQNRIPALSTAARSKPSIARQVLTLLHRSFIKSYRDLTAYWIRVAMYMGLAVMMGTVWLRLSADQDHIQPFINAIVSVGSVHPTGYQKKRIKLTTPTPTVLRLSLHVLHGRRLRPCLPRRPCHVRQRTRQRTLRPDRLPTLKLLNRPTLPLPHQRPLLHRSLLADEHEPDRPGLHDLDNVAVPRPASRRVPRRAALKPLPQLRHRAGIDRFR